MTKDKPNWLFFGAGSPELKFRGSRYNLGAAALDLLAEKHKMSLHETGPIKSTIVEIGGRTVRLIKPNVVPEMVDEVVKIAKEKCLYSEGSVVIFYGDPDTLPGEIKVKAKAGGNGNKVVDAFLKTFDPHVIRIRIGMGRQRKGADLSEDLEEEPGEKILRSLKNAVLLSEIIVRDGFFEGKKFNDLANKGREALWVPNT